MWHPQHPPWQPSSTLSRGTSSHPTMSVSFASLTSARQARRRRIVSSVPQVGGREETIRINQNNAVCVKLPCILSIQVTTERPVQVKVVKVKKSDKGDFYKRQQTWELRDLTEVDAKDASKVRDQSGRSHIGLLGSRVLSGMLLKSSSPLLIFVFFHPLLFRKTLSSTSTLRRCTAGWPAALRRRTPSSPASGSSTSVTPRRSWSLSTLVLSFWKVSELLLLLLLPLFDFSNLYWC